MGLNEFIFSNERKHRIVRHIIFWLCWIMMSMTVQWNITNNVVPSNLFLFQLVKTVIRFFPIFLFCYLMVYFLVPLFISRKKYKLFAAALTISVLLIFILNFLWVTMLMNVFHLENLVVYHTKNISWSLYVRLYNTYYSNINFTGSLSTCCVMLAVNYYKGWYKKERETETLRKENTQAELQLLKAQIHPHFLFNTLNNIYSFALQNHPDAAGLVDKLSGMIDYMTTEGDKFFVPLEKEIQLIKDYIGLEKVRYGDRLAMQIEITGDYKNKFIVPLLMIPFVENCFKHGASKMRGRQWMQMQIRVEYNQLNFKLSNSKPEETMNKESKNGIGLANVKKRLKLLYPASHILKIDSTSESFYVYLQVALQEKEIITIPDKQPFQPELQTTLYD